VESIYEISLAGKVFGGRGRIADLGLYLGVVGAVARGEVGEFDEIHRARGTHHVITVRGLRGGEGRKRKVSGAILLW
jgi:hypothetical protein